MYLNMSRKAVRVRNYLRNMLLVAVYSIEEGGKVAIFSEGLLFY